jgi:ubiquinone/menaquinone biosynthesis C-methylase UbiE
LHRRNKIPQEVIIHGRRFRSRSRKEIHQKIIQLLKEYPPGRVLDFPTGHGSLAWALMNEGFKVVAADAIPEFFQVPEIKVVKADLNKEFPFESNSFDYACFIEGPEHLENPFHAFREFARILKPDGMLITSLPNYSNIQNRLREFFFGSSERFFSGEELRKDYNNCSYLMHINMMTYPEVKMALEFAGFQIQAVEKDKNKTNQNLLWPLALIIMLVSKLRNKRSRDIFSLKETNSRNVLMGGNTLIIKAKKIKNPVSNS